MLLSVRTSSTVSTGERIRLTGTDTQQGPSESAERRRARIQEGETNQGAGAGLSDRQGTRPLTGCRERERV